MKSISLMLIFFGSALIVSADSTMYVYLILRFTLLHTLGLFWEKLQVFLLSSFVMHLLLVFNFFSLKKEMPLWTSKGILHTGTLTKTRCREEGPNMAAKTLFVKVLLEFEMVFAFSLCPRVKNVMSSLGFHCQACKHLSKATFLSRFSLEKVLHDSADLSMKP